MTTLSEQSGSSHDGTQDSWRDATLSGGGDREAPVPSEHPRLSTQRSLTTEMSEDSFAMADTSG